MLRIKRKDGRKAAFLLRGSFFGRAMRYNYARVGERSLYELSSALFTSSKKKVWPSRAVFPLFRDFINSIPRNWISLSQSHDSPCGSKGVAAVSFQHFKELMTEFFVVESEMPEIHTSIVSNRN